jgi:hypothetical protein
MATTTDTKVETTKMGPAATPKTESGYSKWGKRFVKFLAYGGFILILFLIFGIVLAVDMLF